MALRGHFFLLSLAQNSLHEVPNCNYRFNAFSLAWGPGSKNNLDDLGGSY